MSALQNATPGAPTSVFQQRRAKLATALNRPLILFAGHAPARTCATMTHRFIPGSHYRYFGGPRIEDAALLIAPQSDGQTGCTLFRPQPGADDALWEGETTPDAQLARAAGLPETAIQSADRMETALAGRDVVGIGPPFPRTLETMRRLKLTKPTEKEMRAIVALRLIKDEHEIKHMHLAAKVGSAGHIAAMRATGPGKTEWDAEAALLAKMASAGCAPSFNPIVTIQGQVLHGASSGAALSAGQLLLIDAGAQEPDGYCSDITRTFPVSGVWSDVQRHLYETVLRALDAGVKACLPGRRFLEVHNLSARIITEGLIDAGLLRGNVNELTERGAYTLFFPHGVGHLLGLDAHDIEDFGDIAGYPAGRQRPTRFGDYALRLDRDLESGMVVTVEPGIYLVPAIWQRDDLTGPLKDCVSLSTVDALLADNFGGIRIEENVLVRAESEGGPRILTGDVPTDPDQVTALVGNP